MRTEHPRSNVSIDRIPFQRIDASAIRIQRHAQTPSLRLQIRRDAPLIDPLMGIVHEAIIRPPKRHVRYPRLAIGNAHGRVPASRLGSLGHVVHVARLRGVQRRLGRVLVVDALHDVDLPVDGPVGLVGEPEGRPGAAPGGHVAEVDDEEAAVEAAFSLEADGVAWAEGGGGGGDADEGFGGRFATGGVGYQVGVERLQSGRRHVGGDNAVRCLWWLEVAATLFVLRLFRLLLLCL
mmetsp:Transcript_29748/g.50635  ORF Transcript_29748/g.50635 Transcript_29748/m.50635 type:complete len:236 (+) Transcript_29748:433-1140(+)